MSSDGAPRAKEMTSAMQRGYLGASPGSSAPRTEGNRIGGPPARRRTSWASAGRAPHERRGVMAKRRWYGQLWVWVVIAIAAGIVFGLVAPDQAVKAKWLAEAFIQVIKAVTGPVIFVTVVIGIAS